MTRSRSASALCWLAALAGLVACTPTHLRRNAPGNIDVRKPPHDLTKPVVDEQDDPGENLLALTFGVLGGGGGSVRQDASDTGGFALSLEVSVHAAQEHNSHSDDSLSSDTYPRESLGLNLGYQAIAPEWAVDLTVLRPFYLEAQYTWWPIWVAPGWQADFERSRHGPQLTAGLGPLYLRCVHLFEVETQLEAGFVIKGFHVWIWSR